MEEPVQKIWYLVLSDPEFDGLQLPGALEAPYHTLITIKVKYPDGGTEWCRLEKGHHGITFGAIPESWALNYSDERAAVCYLLRHCEGLDIPMEEIYQIAVENAESTNAKHYMQKLATQNDNFATIVNQYLFSSCWLCIDRIAQLVDEDFTLAEHFSNKTGNVVDFIRVVKEK